MKSRIVTVTLAVAMGLWLNRAAHSQTEVEPPISILPEQGFDDLDSALQSELPLQGVPVEPVAVESLTGTQLPPDL
jgi:hypothetical protein